MKVAIVGAGPSALVTAKTLLEAADADANFKPVITIFETESDIGGTFRYRSYSNATLVSSKQLTSFSDFRLPLEHKDHLTLDEYVRYLEDYTAHFKLRQRCDFRFRTSVIKSVKVEGGHLLRFRSLDPQNKDAPDRSELFTHLCVCSGLHVTPALPSIPGLPPTIQGDQVVTEPMGSVETVASRIPEPIQHAANASEIVTLHSSQFKDRSLYRGKRVMVLGTGETGMDMAYEAVKAGAKEVVLCTRSGFLLFPAVLADFVVFGNVFDGNLPIDGLITNLFETAYVHPWVAAAHLRWFVSDFVIKRLLWCLTGTQAGCNQWVGELEPHRLGRAYTFLNKSSKAMPYINRGWKSRSPFLERITTYLDPPTVKPEEVSVDLAPFPARVREDGTVEFVRNGRKEDLRMRNRTVKPDVVVYATGYTQQFDFLSKEYPLPATVRCRDVFDPEDPTVAFIGFVRPGVGAIPPIAEMQAQLWTLILRDRIPAPLSTPHYYLLVKENARIKYGVDYSSYVATLARDMGTAPPLGQLLWTYGLKVTLIYCFGAAFPTFYRLLGPYRHPDAKRIVETEIYDTIRRRGVVGNLMMGLIPMLFYAWVNLAALILETVWNVVSAPTRPFSPRRGTSKAGQQPYEQVWPKARRFQSDFEPLSTSPATATLKNPVNSKATAGQTKPRGRMLRFFALFTALLAVTVTGVEANTEIRNFGPVLCRADEYGHLAAKAADQLSSNWPALRPTTTPSIFSVVPDPYTAPLNDTKKGAWLVLDLSNGGSFTLPAPRQAKLYAELNPRDRWIRQQIDSVAWFFTKRFTLRSSIAAHLALDVQMQLMGPEEVLQRGGVEWKAELVETQHVVEGKKGMQTTAGLPNHVVVSSVVPRETGAPAKRKDDTVVFKQSESSEPVEILASDTISVNPDDAESAPHFPCPKVFLHLVVHETGVPIPPAADLSLSESAFAPLFRLAEAVFGRLASVDVERVDRSAPIHLTLERLYVGGVPATALSMALPMVAMLLLGWFGVRPLLDGLLPTAGKGGKDE
ncbi:related to flavin-containing monooxygenase [Sporisorium reilianum SRZ2]|uniref:Related to flavin-containing monooxygenase n=1 Tax=Sporisorium reilianum (strain SRZ2) TaxID=999809 RepID=E6ZSA1_SPORE|nr:related to flavin-containing monooxygenase [Sporisorium reilianum SRZ2]